MASTYRQPESNDPVSPGRFARSIDASLILGPLWRIGRQSVVCRFVLRILRSFSGRTSWLGSRVANRPALTGMSSLVATSWVLGPVERAFSAVPRVWAYSQTRRLFDGATGPLETWQRVRMIGVAVVVAAATHVALNAQTVLAGSGARIAVVLVVSVGVTLIAMSRSIAAAWHAWK